MQQKANTAKDAQTTEQILNLPVEKIRPFDNHPFQVNDDDELMQQTIDSIMQVGVLNPVIVRPMEDGGYQMVSGHRRLRACELAGIATIPAIARELNDYEAVHLMVDSNIQRENILPSERAKAYRMKMDALKHQGKAAEQTSSQIGTKLRTDEQIAREVGSSRNQVQRFIQHHDFKDYAELAKFCSEVSAKSNAVLSEIKSAEKRMAEISVLRTHIINYSKTRDIYVGYRKAGYSKKYLAEHESDIIIHRAAKKAFDELGLKKLPSVSSLQKEYAALLSEKKEKYADYYRLEKEKRDLLVYKANTERLLQLDAEEPQKSKERQQKEK